MSLPNDVSIEVHSKDGCPYCEKAKDWLAERGKPYVEIKHNDDAERQAFYDGLRLEGRDRSVPQIMLVDLVEEVSYRVGGSDKLETSGIS